VIFNQDIVPVLESARRWEADHEEKAKLVSQQIHEIGRKTIIP
jgi:hypothetical protein